MNWKKLWDKKSFGVINFVFSFFAKKITLILFNI